MATEVIMPKMGQTMEEGTILEWYKAEGDTVAKGEPLYQVESDKAVFDIESPASGTLLQRRFEAGTTVPVLTRLAVIASPQEDLTSYALPEPSDKPMAEASPGPWPQTRAASPPTRPRGRVLASPRARRVAAERGKVLGRGGELAGAGVHVQVDAGGTLVRLPVGGAGRGRPGPLKLDSSVDLESAAYGDEIPIVFPAPQSAPRVTTFDPTISELSIPRMVGIGQEIVDLILQIEPDARMGVTLKRGVQHLYLRNQAPTEVSFKRSPLSIFMEISRVEGDDAVFQRWSQGDTGKGAFHRFRGDMEPPSLYAEFVAQRLRALDKLHQWTQAALATNLPDQVFVSIQQDGHLLILNYDDEPHTLDLPDGTACLVPSYGIVRHAL